MTPWPGALQVGARAPRLEGFSPTDESRPLFLAAVNDIVAPFVDSGWKYAADGPHLTRQVGAVTISITFRAGVSSDSRSGTGNESIGLDVGLMLDDSSHGVWRRSIDRPIRSDDTVFVHDLFRLLKPGSRKQGWMLGRSSTMSAEIADVQATIQAAVDRHLDPAAMVLSADPLVPAQLDGLVMAHAEVEYHVRTGQTQGAASAVTTMLARLGGEATHTFDAYLAKCQSDGSPRFLPTEVPKALAYLAAQFDLPVGPASSG